MADVEPISDPEGFPTNAQLKRRVRSTQTEAMIEWFGYNFEDPGQHTPHDAREGGFQYIWGGPYDAGDQLRDRFEGLVSDGAIRDAVAELESQGWDWVPAQRRIQPEEEDYLDLELHEPAERLRWRTEVITRLDALERALEAANLTRGNIGHNNPPSPIEDDSPVSPSDLLEIQRTISDARIQVDGREPDAQQLFQNASKLSSIAAGIGRWLAKKADTAVDEAIKTGVKAAVVGSVVFAASGQAELHGVQDALNAAAHAIMTFARLIGF